MRQGIRDTGFYQTLAWKNTSKQQFQRDMGICQMCGKVIMGRYVVDHIIELTTENMHIYEIAFDPANLRTLHLECHNMRNANAEFEGETYIEGDKINFDKRTEKHKHEQLREKYLEK